MHHLVDHIASSENKDVVSMAAATIANMSQCSMSRNILKQRDGIRKLVRYSVLANQDKMVSFNIHILKV